jgi:iron complex transport system substrate-binding protein
MCGASNKIRQKSHVSKTSWLVRTFCFILLMGLCISLASAEGEVPDAKPYPRTVTDDQKVEVTLTSVPERIISLAPSNTEVLFALGLDDRVVGVTSYCSYPDQATQKEKIGGFSTVSIEKVTALDPDLVVAADGNNPDTVDRLRNIGIPVYYVDATSMSDIQKTIQNLGTLTGVSDTANLIVDDLTVRSKAVQAEGEKLDKSPSVAHVIWNDPLYVSGKGTFQDELIALCGGVNAFGDKDDHYITSLEEFMSRDPDLLLINAGSGMGGKDSDLATYFRSEPRLSGMRAIKEDHIVVVDSDMADRAGPRLWDLLEKIAPLIRERA